MSAIGTTRGRLNEVYNELTMILCQLPIKEMDKISKSMLKLENLVNDVNQGEPLQTFEELNEGGLIHPSKIN